ncbi:Tyrosine kinase specific for activated [Ceratobasidium sp. AG-Ba]|nr:Tyrosine kinase specific for activated [Ceratobasidium sp. AG-Ba]QRW01208.1 Tyrosine kinase specific for activated [Ceratobasidium sp. AG-Ba]
MSHTGKNTNPLCPIRVEPYSTFSDIASPNIMMDAQPLFTEPFHPYHPFKALDGRTTLYPRYARSQKPVRYYYIDFGYSKRFKEGEGRMVSGWNAREQAPEQVDGDPYDPFKADIYQLGAILRRDLIPSNASLSFLLPIARQMTEEQPCKRPTLAVARRGMNDQFENLSGWRKRWPIIPPFSTPRSRIALYWIGIRTELFHILQTLFRLFVPIY